MIITYLGHFLVKIQEGESVLVFNPYKKGPRFGANIVFVSSYDPLCQEVQQMTYGTKKPFIISGPGEYEVGGIYVRGVASDLNARRSDGQGDKNINTAYLVVFNDLKICHLGMQGDPHISAEIKETVGNIDILFVPIGGGPTLSPSDAARVATFLEPNIVVPIGFSPSSDLKDALNIFLKEWGAHVPAQEKLVPKKKDIESQEGGIVVLKDVFSS